MKGENNEVLRHGKGNMVFEDGSKYDGEWYHDKCHGMGTQTNSTGTQFEQEWQNGKLVKEVEVKLVSKFLISFSG